MRPHRRWPTTPPRQAAIWLAAGIVLGLLVGTSALVHLLRPESANVVARSSEREPGAGDPLGSAPTEAQVATVVDGDTFRLTTGETVRVLSVDTPEFGSEDQPAAQPLAAEARQLAQKLIGGRSVVLEPDGPDRDHFGRLLRHVWVGDYLLAEELVAQGLGKATPREDSSRYREILEVAETEARVARRGIWELESATPLAIFREPPGSAATHGPESPTPRLRFHSGAPISPSEEITAGVGADTVSDSRLPADAGRNSLPCGERVEGAIRSAAAASVLGEYATVEFRVMRTHDSGNVTFLNSHDPYEGHFYAAVFPDEYAAFPSPLAIYLDGRCIVVRGRVELYRGTPQIVVRTADDVRLVGD